MQSYQESVYELDQEGVRKRDLEGHLMQRFFSLDSIVGICQQILLPTESLSRQGMLLSISWQGMNDMSLQLKDINNVKEAVLK